MRAMKKTTIADYLLARLTELGIKAVFGVPGDYNLSFLDHIVNNSSLQWVGNCNELNAAYAADGYARIKGIAAVVTTFGVGELSAINGIAGSYAEHLSVVHIVGAPSTEIQRAGALMHHTFGTGDYEVFINMFEKISVAVAVLDSAETAAKRIDDALEACWIKKQPVYISLPSNMVDVEIDAPRQCLQLAYPESNAELVVKVVSELVILIQNATSPIFLVDLWADRYNMKELLEQLLNATGIPFAVMKMGKGIINESHPAFIGIYNGKFSSPNVQERVEKADCILSFGILMSDFNTGVFTSKINTRVAIEIHSHAVKVHHSIYPNVYFNAVVPALIKALDGYRHKEISYPPSKPHYKPSEHPITQKQFWNNMANYFKTGDIILAETGTSMFGLLDTAIPDDATVIAQSLWGSIGYSVGALMGAAMADRQRRSILFVGDGSFQLSAQEISTMMRHQLNPIIFLLNNSGYTIERVIHGPNMIYNDVQVWNYAELPKIFGNNVFTAKVTMENELATVLLQIEGHRNQLCFIEVMMDEEDCPESLRLLGKAFEATNKQ